MPNVLMQGCLMFSSPSTLRESLARLAILEAPDDRSKNAVTD
jgi:hypothetical protein